MKRVDSYLTEKQIERLHQRAGQEGIPMAELARRAIDGFLAWVTQPTPRFPSPKKGKPIHPRSKEIGRTCPSSVTDVTKLK
jgi:hypothetical protein